MDGIEEDDGYSDDDLDALPVHAFQELQQDAIRSTHQPRALQHHQAPSLKPPAQAATFGNIGAFDRLSVEDYAGNTQQQPSSDYGDFDDEMLDGEIFDTAAEQPNLLHSQLNYLPPARERTPGKPRRQPHPNASPPSRSYHLQWSIRDQRVHPTSEGYDLLSRPVLSEDEPQVTTQIATPPDNPAVLQAKLEELARENERLKREFDSAKMEAFAKTGEIAIVRANRLKEKQDEEKRLADERKLRADELANYRAELQKYKTELQKVSTDKAFIENDLAREAEQRKGLQKISKTAVKKAPGKENTLGTPKKNKDGALGDGFNDDEIQVQSPSKLALRSKPATPKAGAKRKRKATENSPIKPLQLSQAKKDVKGGPSNKSAEYQSIEGPVDVTAGDELKAVVQFSQRDDHRYEFTQKVLDHRLDPGAKRSVEALAAFALPSKAELALSTAFLDELSKLSYKLVIDSFPAALGLIVVQMWSSCLDAELYEAVKLLMDLTYFILTISPPGTAPYFTDELTGLVQRTADVNLIPRIRRKPASALTAIIDTKQCLEILHLMVYDCMWQQEELERFWRCMRVDFIAMALKIDQPIDEIHIALSLLRTSVQHKTFAMIRSPSDDDQESSEQGLIQIISSLFVESPRVLEGREPYDVADIAQLRLDALDLMEKMCESNHGGEALAKCSNVFIRLIRFMNDEIDALYDYKNGHECRIELVNKSTRLLYQITINYPDLINIQERLASTPGGAHKYLIVLTRLNFSDGIFYEKGIEDDVVECAQHMLENWVTPEEGEALVEAFSSARK